MLGRSYRVQSGYGQEISDYRFVCRHLPALGFDLFRDRAGAEVVPAVSIDGCPLALRWLDSSRTVRTRNHSALAANVAERGLERANVFRPLPRRSRLRPTDGSIRRRRHRPRRDSVVDWVACFPVTA